MAERYARSFVEIYNQLKDTEHYEALTDELHEWFSEYGVQTVLDVGCRTGMIDDGEVELEDRFTKLREEEEYDKEEMLDEFEGGVKNVYNYTYRSSIIAMQSR